MPTYEYVCKNCGKSLEVFQSFSDKPMRKHKECGGDLQKVFHARGIVFKGGGFYATDSKPAPAGKSKSDATPDKKESTPAKEKAPEKAATTASSSSSDD